MVSLIEELGLGEGISIGVGFSVSFGLFVVFIGNGLGGVVGLAGVKGIGDGRGNIVVASTVDRSGGNLVGVKVGRFESGGIPWSSHVESRIAHRRLLKREVLGYLYFSDLPLSEPRGTRAVQWGMGGCAIIAVKCLYTCMIGLLRMATCSTCRFRTTSVLVMTEPD
jgi:hypothetical protein